MQSWSWASSWQWCQVSWPGAWPGGHHHTPVRRGLGSPGTWCQVSASTGAPGPVSRVSCWTEGDHCRHSDHVCSVGVAVPEPELPTLSSWIILDSLVTFLLGPCPPSTLSLSLTPCFLPPSLPLCSLLSAAVPGLLLIFYWLGDIWYCRGLGKLFLFPPVLYSKMFQVENQLLFSCTQLLPCKH